ncbi:MAG TPA: UpxY family transcription antiterminator [Candidatus Acidoferrum sp.]
MLKFVQDKSLASKLPWYALQVRARHEKNVTNYLNGMGYETFLPLSKSARQWSDRKKEIDLPLFPGYIFCRFDVQNRLPILKTPGMLQIVGYSRIPIPVDEIEIDAIQSVVASGLPNQPCAFLEVGDRVIVQAGPLTGLEGILVECRGKNRLILSINLLQRSIAVEISSNHVALHPKDTVYTDCNSSRFELEYAS